MNQKSILVASSGGGHWIQLSRLIPSLSGMDVHAAVVDPDSAKNFDFNFRSISSIADFNRLSIYRGVAASFKIFGLLRKIRPSVVISTGAAPGLLVILIAKIFFGSKCLWIDSIANTKRLSYSGRVAQLIRVTVYCQWEEVASSSSSEFHGRVI